MPPPLSPLRRRRHVFDASSLRRHYLIFFAALFFHYWLFIADADICRHADAVVSIHITEYRHQTERCFSADAFAAA